MDLYREPDWHCNTTCNTTTSVSRKEKMMEENRLKMQWITRQNRNTVKFEPGLVFWGSRNDLFGSSTPLRAQLLAAYDELYDIDAELHLLISGFEMPRPGQDAWNQMFVSGKEHVRGKREDGTFRCVYEHVGKDSGLPIRAGVTIHETGGTWSSWPPHDFEAQALAAPRTLFPRFQEVFAYITDPVDMWGIQVLTSAQYDGSVMPLVVVRDRDIHAISLGAHPVVAAPGTRLAYIWAYVGGWEKF